MAKADKEDFVKEASGKITKINTTTETEYNLDGEISALNTEKTAYQQIIKNIDDRIALLNEVKSRHI
jgi:hypothetical protein